MGTSDIQGPTPVTGTRPASAIPGPLRDGPILARWYILFHLAGEVERACRYHRPLSVVLAAPVMLPGDQLAEQAEAIGVAATSMVARRSDLVGWLDGGSILIVMPETAFKDAQAAMFRWRNEITSRSRHKWQFAVVGDAGRFRTTDDLLQAAAERLSQEEAA